MYCSSHPTRRNRRNSTLHTNLTEPWHSPDTPWRLAKSREIRFQYHNTRKRCVANKNMFGLSDFVNCLPRKVRPCVLVLGLKSITPDNASMMKHGNIKSEHLNFIYLCMKRMNNIIQMLLKPLRPYLRCLLCNSTHFTRNNNLVRSPKLLRTSS